MIKKIEKPILFTIFALLLITSCNSVPKFHAPTQHVFSKDSISLDVHCINLNENDKKNTECTDYVYFYPKINGKSTDVHIRAEIDLNSNPGIISCGLNYYQGDPMKMDFDYPGFVKDKRLPERKQGKDVYQTSYQEQLHILEYVKYICEKELCAEYIGYLWYIFEDIGEVNIDITEHCGIIKGVIKGNYLFLPRLSSARHGVREGRFDFTPVMKKTKFAKDIKNIFSDYDINFKGPLALNSISIVSYDEYAAKHNFRKKHDFQYVYLVNSHLIILRKKANDSNDKIDK